jgi:hypothetical protein
VMEIRARCWRNGFAHTLSFLAAAHTRKTPESLSHWC